MKKDLKQLEVIISNVEKMVTDKQISDEELQELFKEVEAWVEANKTITKETK